MRPPRPPEATENTEVTSAGLPAPVFPVLRVAVASPSSPVPVVCAVIERDGRVLIARRPPHKLLPLKWEFPGGKVEPGEEATAAIVREIREELGCAIRVTQALPPFIHDYQTVVIEMIPFRCALAPDSPEPHPHEHVAVAWATPAELQGYDLAAADWPVVAALPV